jgi:L-ribulokinase
VLVDVETGALAATHVTRYSNGIIDEALPGGGARLGNAWALQDPADYLSVIYNSIPAVLKESGVSSGNVIGLGMDFTSCTILPVGCDGLPLCFDE